LGQQNRAWHGHLLHAGGEVGRLAHRRVIHVQIAADGAHHDFPSIQANADLHGHAMTSLHLGSILLHRRLHVQRGIATAHRVILMGNGRSEQSHDAIAHHLIDRPFIAVHRVHHQREDGIEELARVLGVPVGEQCHGAFQVGKEHGDLLALAFEGGLGGEDFLG
jgi:hypothetical protein